MEHWLPNTRKGIAKIKLAGSAGRACKTRRPSFPCLRTLPGLAASPPSGIPPRGGGVVRPPVAGPGGSSRRRNAAAGAARMALPKFTGRVVHGCLSDPANPSRERKGLAKWELFFEIGLAKIREVSR